MKLKASTATALLIGATAAFPAVSSAQFHGSVPGDAYFVGQYPPPYPGPQGPGGWDAPPPDFRQDIQRRGWRDGLDGARKDAENHRPPNVMNRDEYRNYRGPARRLYRAAFQRGYSAFWSHQGPGYGGPRPY